MPDSPQQGVRSFEVGDVEAAEEAREENAASCTNSVLRSICSYAGRLVVGRDLASIGLRRDKEDPAVPIRDENIMKQHGVPSIRAPN